MGKIAAACFSFERPWMLLYQRRDTEKTGRRFHQKNVPAREKITWHCILTHATYASIISHADGWATPQPGPRWAHERLVRLNRVARVGRISDPTASHVTLSLSTLTPLSQTLAPAGSSPPHAAPLPSSASPLSLLRLGLHRPPSVCATLFRLGSCHPPPPRAAPPSSVLSRANRR